MTQRDKDGNNWFWCDAIPGAVDSSDAASPSGFGILFPGVTGSNVPGNGVTWFTVSLYRFFGGSPQLVQQQQLTGPVATVGGYGSLTFTLNNDDEPDYPGGTFPTYSDYYAFFISNITAPESAAIGTAVRSGAQVTEQGVCSVLQHRPVKEFRSLMNVFSDKGRINALATRVTDIPMLQYQNGLIAGATLYAGNEWYGGDWVTRATLRSFAPRHLQLTRTQVQPLPVWAAGQRRVLQQGGQAQGGQGA